MSVPASRDLRLRVVQAYLRGEGTYEQIAARFQVGSASVSRWLGLFRRTGDVEPKPHGGGMTPRIDSDGLEWLADLVSEQPDITLAELAQHYEAKKGAQVALSIMCRAMQKLGLVRKKRQSSPRSANLTV